MVDYENFSSCFKCTVCLTKIDSGEQYSIDYPSDIVCFNCMQKRSLPSPGDSSVEIKKENISGTRSFLFTKNLPISTRNQQFHKIRKVTAEHGCVDRRVPYRTLDVLDRKLYKHLVRVVSQYFRPALYF